MTKVKSALYGIAALIALVGVPVLIEGEPIKALAASVIAVVCVCIAGRM